MVCNFRMIPSRIFDSSSIPCNRDTRNEVRSHSCANHPATQYHFHFRQLRHRLVGGMRRDIVAGMAKCMDGVDVDIHGFDDHSMPMRDRRVQPQVDSGQHGIAGGFMRALGILLMTNVFFIAEREVDEAGRRGRGDRMSRANRRRRDSRRAHCRVAEAVHQTAR